MKIQSISQALDSHLTKLGKVFVESPWKDQNFYGAWLAQTTYYVLHSTRLLALSAARTPLELQPFHTRFIEHADEEKGHENLSLLDLKHLNMNISDIPEFASTQSFYQTQYYWIEHESALAFFGYILCLECLAAKYCPDVNSIVESHYGPKGAHFIRVHGKEDIDHVEKAIKYVNELSTEQQNIIIKNMSQSFQNYENILKECEQFAEQKKITRNAS